MADSADLLVVGRLGRPHGLNGEILAHLTTNRSERTDPGATLYAEGRELTVTTSRPKGNGVLLAFDGYDSRESLADLVGCELLAEPMEDPDEIWVHELIGSEVVDVAGTRHGTIIAVEANPASDLLVLDSGALVPVRFIVEMDQDGIRVDVPDGLFDL